MDLAVLGQTMKMVCTEETKTKKKNHDSKNLDFSQLVFEDTNSLDSEMNQNRYANPTSPSAEIAMSMNTNSHKLQLMKASLFVDEEYDNKSGEFLLDSQLW